MAFPALVDQGEKAGLRLFDAPQTAAAVHRGGVRRLAQLALARELRSIVESWPEANRLHLFFAGRGMGPTWRGELQTLLAEAAVLGASEAPRLAAEFEGLLKAARTRLGPAAQQVAAWLGPCVEEWRATQKALEGLRLPAARFVVDDVRRQLEELVPAGFLLTTPREWLEQLPRYLKAARVRLEKAPRRLPADQKLLTEFMGKAERFRTLMVRRGSEGALDVEATRYRWWLEEWRVSLFAQELKTAVPVSPQRLDKQWELVVAER
jgi:ATP-dependent helicase HrpA